MKKTLKFNLLLLLIPFMAVSQLEIPEGYTVVDKSPASGKPMGQMFLDFDNDLEEDTAVIVENTSQFSTYKFLLYVSSKHKTYAVDLINPNEFAVYPVQIKLRKNVLEFGYYEDGSAAFGRFIKLRYNPKNETIEVIGYDVEFKASPSERINKSYNVLTGKYVVKKTTYNINEKKSTKEFTGRNDVLRNTVFIENLNEELFVKLDAVGSNYESNTEFQKSKKKVQIDDFVPKGFVIFEKTYGDLNKDEQKDCILTIKGTDKNNIVENEYGEIVDRNRRGIIVLFKNQDGYQLAVSNHNCFSSENEDGGVYFPPELLVNEERGNLIIHYAHGRYGFWKYVFRFQEENFMLIGYDESNNRGPIINSQTSINFLTKKKLIRENTNAHAIGGDEVFKEIWHKINIEQLLNLYEIEDFDELNMSF